MNNLAEARGSGPMEAIYAVIRDLAESGEPITVGTVGTHPQLCDVPISDRYTTIERAIANYHDEAAADEAIEREAIQGEPPARAAAVVPIAPAVARFRAAAHAQLHRAPEPEPAAEGELPPEACEVERVAINIAPVRAWPSAAALARAIAAAPCPERLPLGFPTLAELTHGGVPTARRVVIVGAPGAGKTALAVQWAHDWAPSARVVYLASDQSAEDVLCRAGQRGGLYRDDLDGVSGEEPRRCAWATLAERLSALPELIVLDGSTHTVEDAVACALAPSTVAARVVVIDSIQTARCAAAEGASSRRDSMDAALGVVRSACARGVLAVIVSEMARGGYRSGDPSQLTSALASAKESGSVEYGADLLLGLRSVQGEPDLVDVEVAKSRLGPRGELRLRLERARATLHETDRPDPDEETEAREAAREAKRERAVSEAEPAVLRAVLRARTPITSRAALAELVGGRTAYVEAAITRLLGNGRLTRDGGTYRSVSEGEGGGIQ